MPAILKSVLLGVGAILATMASLMIVNGPVPVHAVLPGSVEYLVTVDGFTGTLNCSSDVAQTWYACSYWTYATAPRNQPPVLAANPLASPGVTQMRESGPSFWQLNNIFPLTNPVRAPLYTGPPLAPISYSEDAHHCTFVSPIRRPGEVDLPVDIWFHGGAGESQGETAYESRIQAVENRTIVITCNYRLDRLSADVTTEGNENEPINFGLQDGVAVLRYWHPIVGLLGGDRTKITVSCQSFGCEVAGLLPTYRGPGWPNDPSGINSGWGSGWYNPATGKGRLFSRLFLSSPYRVTDPQPRGYYSDLGMTVPNYICMQLGFTSNPPPNPAKLTAEARAAYDAAPIAQIMSVVIPGIAAGPFHWRADYVVDGSTIPARLATVVREMDPKPAPLDILESIQWNEGVLFQFVLDSASFVDAATFRLNIAKDLGTRGLQALLNLVLSYFGDRAFNTPAPLPGALPPVWPGAKDAAGVSPNFLHSIRLYREWSMITAQAMRYAEIMHMRKDTIVYLVILTNPSPYTLNSHSSDLQQITGFPFSTTPFTAYYSRQSLLYRNFLARFFVHGNPNGPSHSGNSNDCGHGAVVDPLQWKPYAGSGRNVFEMGAASTNAEYHPTGCDIILVSAISGGYPYPCAQDASATVVAIIFIRMDLTMAAYGA